VTGGDDSMIAVWTLPAGSPRSNFDFEEPTFIGVNPYMAGFELCGFLNGHVEAISCLRVSVAFNAIVSASKDRTMIVWDLNRLLCSFSITGFASPIVDVAISEDSGDIVACTKTDICVWDINGRAIASYTHNGSSISCVAITCPLGHVVKFTDLIVTGHEDGVINIFEVILSPKEDEPETQKKKTLLRRSTSFNVPSLSWGTSSRSWIINLRKTVDRGHRAAVRTILIPSDNSGFWSGDWAGTVLTWGATPEDIAEDSLVSTAFKLFVAPDEIRTVPCAKCAKRQWKKTDLRYPCAQHKQVFCSGCIMDHLRQHEFVPPSFWLPHVAISPTRGHEARSGR
jgi:WD40 repeat protein